MPQKTVRLIRSHEHAGQKLKPGSQLVLDEKRAAWLIDQGAAVDAKDWTAKRAALLTSPSAAQPAKAAKPAPKSTGCCGQRSR